MCVWYLRWEGILYNSFALCKMIAYSKTFVEYEVMEMNGFI